MPPLNIVLKQGINQTLDVREEAGQVETVRNCVVYAHRDRHRQSPAFERIFAHVTTGARNLPSSNTCMSKLLYRSHGRQETSKWFPAGPL